jgi:hypothetical protein
VLSRALAAYGDIRRDSGSSGGTTSSIPRDSVGWGSLATSWFWRQKYGGRQKQLL